jgi:hypothetical protein
MRKMIEYATWPAAPVIATLRGGLANGIIVGFVDIDMRLSPPARAMNWPIRLSIE